MYGLAEGIDLSFLKGREVIQVAVGLYQVIFALDEKVTISVEGSYELHGTEGVSVWTPGATQVAARALSLLGTTITNACATSDGSLDLSFSNDESLVILDASKSYESYQITKPGSAIVV
jgi:hypothetical protein